MRLHRLPWLTAAVVLLAAGASALFAAGAADGLVAQGPVWQQPWRLLTGPFVHASGGHLLRCLPAFAVCLALLEGAAGRARVLPLLALALALPAAGVLLLEGTPRYFGLSGATYALAFVLVVEAWRRGALGPWSAWLMVGLVAKVVVEGSLGHLLVASEHGPGVTPVPLAHSIGALVGLVAALATRAAPGPRRRGRAYGATASRGAPRTAASAARSSGGSNGLCSRTAPSRAASWLWSCSSK